MMMMAFFFWLSVFLVLYPHIFYPVVLLCLKQRKDIPLKHEYKPVTIVCAAYNEEQVIAEKIGNFYEIDYPDVQLYIGLDGCTDGTLSEIKKNIKDKRVKYFVFPRAGKAKTINALMKEVTTPYAVLTDANSMFEKDAVTCLVRRMSDDTGVVCGRLALVDESGNSGEGIYWKIETFVKKRESAFGSVMGANGAIYLIRTDLFEDLPVGTINDDFTVSMQIYERGYASVYAEDAVAIEEVAESDKDEYKRHVRDAAGHFRALVYLWRLLNPLRVKRFFFYMSHRVIRWLAPFFIMAAFVVNLMLSDKPFYKVILLMQCLMYIIMAAVHFLKIRFKPLYIPYYFMLVNCAILAGFCRNLAGLQKNTWDSTKR